jgi:uncharacterized PurR-regulated membrane protein YhhQ (DUF165 family)
MPYLILYIAIIFLANWAIQFFHLVPVGFGLMAPAGVYFAGLAFTLRDLVQDRMGRAWTIAAILAGAMLSYAIDPKFALASGLAFLVSESLDFAVYSPLRRRSWLGAVAASNLAGLLADSALFLWLAFGSLDFLAGQVLGKMWMTALAVALLALWKQRKNRALAA